VSQNDPSQPTSVEEVALLRQRLADTEAELAKANAMLEVAERTGHIGLWQADMASGEGEWSPTMYPLYRRDPEAGPPSLGTMAGFVHPEDLDRMTASLQEMMEQPPGTVPAISFRTHPDLGPVRHLETCATMLMAGEAPWATGAVIDVSEREGARHDAAVAHHRLGQILDRMPFVVFSLDPAGKITSSNRAPQTVGMDYLVFCADDSRDDMERALAKAWATGEVQLVRAGDTLGRWWESRIVGVTDPAGEIRELLGVTLEITAQRQLEKKLNDAQKLESLGVLAGGIAHDFNNLLVGIIGNADLALHDVTASSPTHESLVDILTASHRAADLCRQMLAYSGRGRFVVQTVDPREVIEEMTHLLRASIAKTAVLSFAFSPDTKPVDADISQLRQVVMNLITNASDALDGRDGIITLASGTLHADAEYLARAYLRTDLVPGPYTYIEVSDTGDGMDEETKARIFEPFFSSKAVGRGLGLAAVSGIVRGHKGAIRVYSELGKGTTIKVLLPASTHEAAPTKVPVSHTASERVQGIVLVVDDEAAVRRLARRSLERLGFTVIEAEDGHVAVEAYRAQPHDIVGVLLDMTMPVMGGEETFRQLRVIDPDVRVLLSSGYNEQEATRRFAGKGLAGFLQKPYRATELQEAMLDLVDP